MRKTLLLALTVAALTAGGAGVALAQDAAPSRSDLCTLARTDVVAALRAEVDALALIPRGLYSDEALASLMRSRGCGGVPAATDSAASLARVCAVLTVGKVNDAVDDAAGNTTGVVAASLAGVNVSAADVAAVRRAIECDGPTTAAATTATSTPAAPTSTAPTGGGFTQVGADAVPVGGVDTGA